MEITRRIGWDQPQHQPITHLVMVADRIMPHLMHLHNRAYGNYHDLIVLMGPKDQTGSVRLLTDAFIALNSQPYHPFRDVISVIHQALQGYLPTHPNDAVIGIGTAVGIKGDLPIFFRAGYDIYYAGGSELQTVRDFGVIDFGQGKFYVEGPGGVPVYIPGSRLHFANEGGRSDRL